MKRLGLFLAASVAIGTAPLQAVMVKNVDPCKFAPASVLAPMIQVALTNNFPLTWTKPGKKVTIKDPKLLNTTCSPLKVEIRATVHYKDTRGLDQGSATGEVRFTSTILGHVSYNGTAPGPVTAANFVSANGCFGDISILGLNIHNVPNWLDNTWIRGILHDKLAGQQFCPMNISPQVAAYLATGGQIP
jgi:hypothetical protein